METNKKLIKKFCNLYRKDGSRFYTVTNSYNGVRYIYPSIEELAEDIVHQVQTTYKDTLMIDDEGEIVCDDHSHPAIEIYTEDETIEHELEIYLQEETLKNLSNLTMPYIELIKDYENFEKYKKYFYGLFETENPEIELTLSEFKIADSVWGNEMTGENWTDYNEETLTELLKEKRKKQKLCWLSNKRIKKIVSRLLEWMNEEIITQDLLKDEEFLFEYPG